MTIHIDLNNLTRAAIERAFGAGGICRYSSPCILGSLMSKKDFKYLYANHLDKAAINQLVALSVVSFPTEEQATDAHCIQTAFDYGDRARVEELVKKYM